MLRGVYSSNKCGDRHMSACILDIKVENLVGKVEGK